MSGQTPNNDTPERAIEKPMKQTDEPWKNPMPKEQRPDDSPKPDLERWKDSGTH